MANLLVGATAGGLEKNKGFVPGAVDGVEKIISGVSSSAAGVLYPTVEVANNLGSIASNPGNLIKKETYPKLGKGALKLIMSTAASSLNFPFRTIDDLWKYAITENMDRAGESLRGMTTGSIAAFLKGENPGKFRDFTLGNMGKLVDGAGKLIFSAINLAPRGVGEATKFANNLTYKWSEKAQDSFDKERIYKNKIFDPKILSNNSNGGVPMKSDYVESNNSSLKEKPENLKEEKTGT